MRLAGNTWQRLSPSKGSYFSQSRETTMTQHSLVPRLLPESLGTRLDTTHTYACIFNFVENEVSDEEQPALTGYRHKTCSLHLSLDTMLGTSHTYACSFNFVEK